MSPGQPNGDRNEAQRPTRADRTYERLREDLVRGRFDPGSRLRLVTLCGLYGVGMSPVREALSRLGSEGFVRAISQKGFRVSAVNLNELADLTLARESLETECLRLSITSAGQDWEDAVKASFERLNSLDELLADRAEDIIDDWETHNSQFHRALVAACPSQWLLRLRDLLYDQSRRYRRFAVLRSANIRRAHEEHRAIMKCALNRDSEAAGELIRAHIRTTSRTIYEAMALDAEVD